MRLSQIVSGIICHQVNCLGYMGCGAALAIRNLFPIVYSKYRVFGHKTGNGAWQLGMIQLISINDHLRVANLAAQFGIGRTKRMTDYAALETCLSKLQQVAGDQTVYFPDHMGSRNAGGDWAIVSSLITKYFPNAQFFSRD